MKKWKTTEIYNEINRIDSENSALFCIKQPGLYRRKDYRIQRLEKEAFGSGFHSKNTRCGRALGALNNKNNDNTTKITNGRLYMD